jgi:hypothetical protein
MVELLILDLDQMTIDMIIDIEILIITDMDILTTMVIILDILIELDIFIIIYSFYMIIDTHIMTDYIEEVILNLLIRTIENISIIKTTTGIELTNLEIIVSQFMDHIMINNMQNQKRNINMIETIDIIENIEMIEDFIDNK